MKHLQYFLDTANNAALTSKYAGFINAQASGIVHYATGAGYTVSPGQHRNDLWLLTSCLSFRSAVCGMHPTLVSNIHCGMYRLSLDLMLSCCAGGSEFTPKSQSSGMAGLVCAAKVSIPQALTAYMFADPSPTTSTLTVKKRSKRTYHERNHMLYVLGSVTLLSDRPCVVFIRTMKNHPAYMKGS